MRVGQGILVAVCDNRISTESAASVLLMIGVIRLYPPAQSDLQQVVLSHVNSELKHLTERKEVRAAQLDALLRGWAAI
jgi:hypothetical protein